MAKYSDFKGDLSVHPINGDLQRLLDHNAISTQIKNLIFIAPYEMHWNPTMGAGIPQTLFDNFGKDSEKLIRDKIKEVIRIYVKRAKLNDVLVKFDGKNGYEVTIVYTPINSLEPVTITQMLARTR